MKNLLINNIIDRMDRLRKPGKFIRSENKNDSSGSSIYEYIPSVNLKLIKNIGSFRINKFLRSEIIRKVKQDTSLMFRIIFQYNIKMTGTAILHWKTPWCSGALSYLSGAKVTDIKTFSIVCLGFSKRLYRISFIPGVISDFIRKLSGSCRRSAGFTGGIWEDIGNNTIVYIDIPECLRNLPEIIEHCSAYIRNIPAHLCRSYTKNFYTSMFIRRSPVNA